MNLYAKLEKKFSKYAISGLTLYIIAAYVLGYIMTLISPTTMHFLTLEPAYILRGQIWRLFTWILIPPTSLDILTLLFLYCYYWMGTALEKTWGKFRYNLFIFSGFFFTIAGSFVMLLIGYLYSGVFGSMGHIFTSYYVSISIFLAYAVTYPETEVLIYLIIPVKVKWMAILDVIYLCFCFYVGSWADRVAIIASLLNVIILFLQMQKTKVKRIRKKRTFEKKLNQGKKAEAASKPYLHKCAVCGRTEKDDPNLEFRFCSKCKGDYEYCQDHLFTHEHKS